MCAFADAGRREYGGVAEVLARQVAGYSILCQNFDTISNAAAPALTKRSLG
jgi:hypothetical protein